MTASVSWPPARVCGVGLAVEARCEKRERRLLTRGGHAEMYIQLEPKRPRQKNRRRIMVHLALPWAIRAHKTKCFCTFAM